jgi:galactokinase/N-acetylgalactosamine kinase
MDQAASVMSNTSSALYITFYPVLSASPVPIPTHARFIISNSLVVSDKARTAKYRYNLRVVETLVGARILARALNVKLHDITDGSGGKKYERVTYREVLGRLVSEPQGCGSEGDMGVEALIVALKSVLKKLQCLLPAGVSENDLDAGKQVGVTMEQMIEMSGLSSKVFHDVYLSWVEGKASLVRLLVTKVVLICTV